ncbi:uromodulin-like [Rhinoderma darwinii]|uniref:uromodulin-like n=1 Tax=Rhinoderma darwinii TaxID=43563 RepID=UPI003F66E2A6
MQTKIKISAFQFQGYAKMFIFCDVELCIENCTATCNIDGPSSNALQLSDVPGILTSMTTCPRDELCVISGSIEICECSTTAPINSSLEDAIVAVFCEPKSMKVALRECLLVQLGYNPSSVQLNKNESWCSIVYSRVLNDTRMYTIEVEPYTGCCGNTIMVNSSHVTYSNTLHIESISASSREWTVNISCTYSLLWESQLILSVQQENGKLTVSEVYACNDLLCASIYKNDQFTHLLFKGESLDENSTLFIVINTSLQESDRFHIVVDEFLISSSSSSSSIQIMQNGVFDSPFQLLSYWTPTKAIFSVQTTLFTNQSRTSLSITARLCDSYTEDCCKFLLKLLQES